MVTIRRMKRCIAVLLFCSVSFLARADTLADIRSSKSLKVGLQAGYVPFAMRKPDGSYVGYEIEMMKAFAKRLGVAASFVDTKWEGIIVSLHARKFDVIVAGMTITPERAKAVLFSEPYYLSGLKLLLAHKYAGKFKNLAEFDAAGLSLGVQLGTTGDFFATRSMKKAKIVRLDLESDVANAVLLGKMDGFIFDAPFLQLFSHRHQGKVELLPDLLSEEKLGLAARKSDQSLVSEFNAFLADWKKSGESERTAKAFFQDRVWLKDFPQLMN